MRRQILPTRDLRDLLNRTTIRAHAPGRIDCGGTWDLKALSLPYETFRPLTVNIAVDIRTTVRLSPYDEGMVAVASPGFDDEVAPAHALPFRTPLGLVFAIASHFGVSGIRIDLESEIPRQSGLGGSGAIAVTVVSAIAKALELQGCSRRLTKARLAVLAHSLEDGMGFSLTGLQDQLAAVYGGVHRWEWRYSCPEKPFSRRPVVRSSQFSDLSRHLLIVYTGESRDSSSATSSYIASFIDGRYRKEWLVIRQLTSDFADALERGNWRNAVEALGQEAAIRASMRADQETVLANQLMADANRRHCAAAYAGGNRAGCIWAIGPDQRAIAHLRADWERTIGESGRGCMLRTQVARTGVVIGLDDTST
jgi:D-glycero-alpha-D-manno-heptose-7-phosphate kinase